MNTYVAFLRAIHVGGNTIVKMDMLRAQFESLGFKNVQTCIQSGNVIFETDKKDTFALKSRIKRQLKRGLGKSIQAFVRTTREIESITKKSFYTPTDEEKSWESKTYHNSSLCITA